jgi:mono/diheme cytochrome c family protein
VLLKALDDAHAQVRKAAVWISEPFLKQGDEQLLAKVATMNQEASDDVKTQLMLSLFSIPSPLAKTTVEELMSKNPNHEMLKSVQESLFKTEEKKKYGSKLTVLDPFSRKMVLNGSATFKSLCASCHGQDGKGLPSKVAPPLGINYVRFMEKKEGQIKILLHGLTGPVEGVTYTNIMPPMGANSDEWIASVLSYIRYDLVLSGQSSPSPIPAEYLPKILVKPQEVKKIREETRGRTQLWTWAELDGPAK